MKTIKCKYCKQIHTIEHSQYYCPKVFGGTVYVNPPKGRLVFTKKLPTKEGYYWWTNFGEHTPTILRVDRDYTTKTLWASDEEFCFEIKAPTKKEIDELEKDREEDDWREVGGFKYGDELWCYIPSPFLPGGKKQLKPDCY
jgi:hypothetical protein